MAARRGQPRWRGRWARAGGRSSRPTSSTSPAPACARCSAAHGYEVARRSRRSRRRSRVRYYLAPRSSGYSPPLARGARRRGAERVGLADRHVGARLPRPHARDRAARAADVGRGVSSRRARHGDLEEDVQRIGRELAAAFPSAARHPLRALDERAMDYGLGRRRAARRAVPLRRRRPRLPRRSTTSRATSPRFLDEVEDRPPPLQAAMRMGDSRAGRAALGAAAAAGVRHMAHRFIVGETPAGGRGRAALAVARRRRDARSTCSARRPSPPAEADRYAAALRRGAATSSPRRTRSWPARPDPRADSARPAAAREPLGEGLGADAAAAARRARARQARRRRPPARAAARRRASSARTCTSTWSRSTRARRSSTWSSSCSPSRSSPTARRRASCSRPTCATRPSQLDRILEWAGASARATPPLTVRLVKGAYWDHEVIEARQHGWPAPVFEDKADCDRNFEALTRRLLDARPRVRVAIASHNLRSVAHAIAYAPPVGRATTRTSSSRCCAASATTSRTRWPRSGLRVRTYCPVGDLVAGMAYLVRRLLENTANESFLPSSRRAAPLEELLARAVKPFANEPRPRAAPRAACARRSPTRWRALDARLPLRVPVWIGDERRDGDELVSTDPGDPERVVATRRARHRGGRRRRRRGRGARRAARGRARPAAERAAGPRRRRRAAARAAPRARRPRGARVRQAVARGRRRRLRGDRLPRVLRARGGRARARAPTLLQVPGERNELRYAPRGVVAVDRARGTSRSRSRCGMTAARAGHRQRRGPQARRAVARAARWSSCGRCARPACPPDALALLPGEGDAGAALVRHPGVHTIAFTGSAAGRPGDPRRRPRGRRRPAPPQARHRRDGRQELRDRRRRRRPRRGRSRRSSPRPSSTPARSARPPRACSSTRPSPTPCSSASPARSTCSWSARPTSRATDVPPVIERAAQERVARYAALAAERGHDRRARPRRPLDRAGSARPRSPPTCPPARPCSRRRSSARCWRSSACRTSTPPATSSTGLPLRAHRRPVRRNPARVERVVAPLAGRQPLRQPRHHRRDGRPPALRRQPAVGHRHQGRRPRLPAALRRAARGHREHRCATASWSDGGLGDARPGTARAAGGRRTARDGRRRPSSVALARRRPAWPSTAREHLDLVAVLRDPRRADEHGPQRPALEAGDVEVGLERADLAAERVALARRCPSGRGGRGRA